MIVGCRVALLVALFFAGSAYPAGTSYVGDGQLIDHGRHRLINRYEVILGTVSIGGEDRKEYRFRGLPHREFVLGLRLDQPSCALRQSAAMVSFTVSNERGESVVHEERLLRDLVWQTLLGTECRAPFGYVRGSAAATLAGKRDCAESPDQGRGTYFVARTEGAYQVSIVVRTPKDSTDAGRVATVALRDNGVPPPVSSCN